MYTCTHILELIWVNDPDCRVRDVDHVRALDLVDEVASQLGNTTDSTHTPYTTS